MLITVLVITLSLGARPPAASAFTNEQVASATGDALQSLAVLMIITGAEKVRKQLYVWRLQKKPVDVKLLSELSGKAALSLLNEPMTWTAIAGHITTGITVGTATSLLVDSLLRSSRLRPALLLTLQSAIVNALTSGAWQTGKRLWQKNRAALKDPDERRRAGESTAMLIGLAQASQLATTEEGQKDLHVLKKMSSGMVTTLFETPDVRRRFFSQTWGQEVLSADSITRTLATVGTNALLLLLSEHTPRLVLYTFGVSAGVASMLIPDEVTDTLNDGILWSLVRVAKSLSRKCDDRLLSMSSAVALTPHLQYDKLTAQIDKCRGRRNALINRRIETLYRYQNRLRKLIEFIDAANEGHNWEVAGELAHRLATTRTEVLEQSRLIRATYQHHLEVIEKLRLSTTDRNIHLLLNCAERSAATVKNALEPLLQKIQPPEVLRHTRDVAVEPLEYFHLEGFSEELILDRHHSELGACLALR